MTNPEKGSTSKNVFDISVAEKIQLSAKMDRLSLYRSLAASEIAKDHGVLFIPAAVAAAGCLTASHKTLAYTDSCCKA